MKLSEQWLREWVNPAITQEALRAKLTMAGLEIESLTPVANTFSNVVVAQVMSAEKHPDADRLKVCQVNIGEAEPITIVCGDPKVAAGMKVAAALVGAVLPTMKISKGKLRGVTSYGMLCSKVELSLAEESNGIMVLPEDAPIGQSVWEYLKLSDAVMDINITPNRGDCLSVLGVATEVKALTECELKSPTISPIHAEIHDTLPVIVDAPEACPRYVGRVIRGVSMTAATPIEMQERLRRSGIRSINPVVDVMNYVMLELGQPMHAFDLQKISGTLRVRFSKADETIVTLDEQTRVIHSGILTISDDKNLLALAGVMGGLESGVSAQTTDIFLESAYFAPQYIAPAVRTYKLTSDSSYRFERGIDPSLQALAIERATALLLSIVGGHPGPLIKVESETHLPKQAVIHLRSQRVKRILGFHIPDDVIENLLKQLSFGVEKTADGWRVTVPLRRPDLVLEVDLIEEIIRLYGYDQLPAQTGPAILRMHPQAETQISVIQFRQVLRDLGYQEVITYSFVDQKQQQLLDPHQLPKLLLNPIAADMNAMRTNLWPGLINTYLYNVNRQQSRVRIFETGLSFIENEEGISQKRVLSGLISGSVTVEQWPNKERAADFFDIKGDIQTLIKLSKCDNEITYQPCSHPALHPGQSAMIYRGEQYMGLFGALHPEVAQQLDISNPLFVFELALDALEEAYMPVYKEISKFPEIRRDLAILIDQTVPAQQIQDTIVEVGGEWLKSVVIFDVYQGKGVPEHRKSIALALTLQHTSRTLVDEEVADVFGRIVDVLKRKFTAELRS